MKRAKKYGWDPGGSIMIHGLPNRLKREPDYYTAQRLDRRLHRGLQLRHGGDLAADRTTTRPSTSCPEGLRLHAIVDLPEVVDASVGPRGSLETLSQSEIEVAAQFRAGRYTRCFANARWPCSIPAATATTPSCCSTATATSTSSWCAIPGASACEIRNAPASAFVDGQMIRGIQEHLFAVLRDVVFITNEVGRAAASISTTSDGITNAVFHVLRNARHAAARGRTQSGGVLGRALDQRARSTNTPRRWATNSACAA